MHDVAPTHLVMAGRRPLSRRSLPTWLELRADPSCGRPRRSRGRGLGRRGRAGRRARVRRACDRQRDRHERHARRDQVREHARIPLGVDERPVALRVECRPTWTHLFVVDPDPEEPDPEPRDLLDESGRGLKIVGATGVWWMRPAPMARPSTPLCHGRNRITPEELRRRVICEQLIPWESDRSDELLRPREVAEIFGVRPATVARWAREGRLTPILMPGGHRRYRRSDVRRVTAEDPQPYGSDEEWRMAEDAVRFYEQGWSDTSARSP